SAMPFGSLGSLSLASLNQRSNSANGSFSANSAASSGGAGASGSYFGEGGMRSSPDKESCSPLCSTGYKPSDMSHNTFGHLFRVTTWGENHGPAIGCVVDGCPPALPLTAADIQFWLERRKPGQSRFVTQR